MFGRFGQTRISAGGGQAALPVDERADAGSASSRRSILKGGMFGIAGIVGWSAAAVMPRGPATDTAAAGATAAAAAGTLGSLELGGSGFSFGDDGAGAFSTHGELTGPGGASLGSFDSAPLGSAVGGPHAGVQFQTFNLSDGSIFGMGAAATGDDPATTFAVVGGTGKYAGATGSYLADIRPADAGGDGSAQFEFTFTH